MDARVKPAHDDAWLLIKPPRFLGQHDRNAVADRVGELGGSGDQLLLLAVVFEGALGEWAHQDFEELRIDAAGGTFGHVGFQLMAQASTSAMAIAAWFRRRCLLRVRSR